MIGGAIFAVLFPSIQGQMFNIARSLLQVIQIIVVPDVGHNGSCHIASSFASSPYLCMRVIPQKVVRSHFSLAS